jgi:hypothetical protein
MLYLIPKLRIRNPNNGKILKKTLLGPQILENTLDKNKYTSFVRSPGLLFAELSINHHETIQLTNKTINMKKFLVVLSIGAFAACNNSASTEAKSADSTKMSADSSKMSMDSSKMSMDSSAKKMDSSAKKMDSVKK